MNPPSGWATDTWPEVTAAMDASGRLAVRELGAERATMLKRREEVLKSEEQWQWRMELVV